MRKKSRPVPHTSGDVPASLAVGPCIEVWQDDDGATRGHLSAFRNFSRARRGWLRDKDVRDVAHQRELVPSRGAPFAVAFLIETGRGDHAAERLATAGVTVDDLPALRAEALSLLDAYADP